MSLYLFFVYVLLAQIILIIHTHKYKGITNDSNYAASFTSMSPPVRDLEYFDRLIFVAQSVHETAGYSYETFSKIRQNTTAMKVKSIVLGGVMFSVFASGPKFRGYKPSRGKSPFKGDKTQYHDFLRRGSTNAVSPTS
jgi:hypothetical protein